MLKQRIITALILLPVALCGFFLLQGGAFALFIGAVVCLGGWEWAHLAGYSRPAARIGYAALIALGLLLLHALPQLALPVLILGLAWWAQALRLVLGFPESLASWEGPRKLLLGLPVLLPAWQGLVLLKAMPAGNWLILAVMLLVWCADVGAYFSGRRFGKRKLAPKVSPGKSWEGFYGGLVACLLLTLVVGLVRGWPVAVLLGALLGTLAVVALSVLGDLSESMFKRQAGLKDSSNLLPGHGGVLDRIDSLTAAIPLFTLLLWVFGQSLS